jgi:hypothetical protein
VTVYADNPNTHERICTVLLECRIRPKVQWFVPHTLYNPLTKPLLLHITLREC